MHKLTIIGVSGQAGSGKDTVANYLAEQYNFAKVALADPIKRFGYHVFLFNSVQLWGASELRNAIDARYNDSYAWDEAQGRLEAYGKGYIIDVLGTDDISEVQPAMKALVHWFFWLRENYQGKLSPRVMLQTLGTEWGREAVEENLWINYLLRTARTLLHEDGNSKHWIYDALEGCIDRKWMNGFLRQEHRPVRGVVVSDIRFENEFKRIRDEGGAVIRVIRPDTDQNAATLGIAGHASEAHDYSFQNFDFILNNEGTLIDLYRALDTYMTAFAATHH